METGTELNAAPAVSHPWALIAKNLIFPIFCHQCDARLLTEENGYFCPTCWEMVGRIERPYCTVCGQPQAGRLGFEFQDNYCCAACREAPRLSDGRIYGALYYEDAVAEAVKLLKFHGKTRLAGPLAEAMMAFAFREMARDGYDALVPVPLHAVRRRERGFNQAVLLAGGIAQAFPGADVWEVLVRTRPTRIQSRSAGEAARIANMRGAFALKAGASVTGRRLLLVDDVVTTGSTVVECARVLREAGAARVDVLCAAMATRRIAP